jgi:uncharacterized protein YbjQ (UPF0145 family)
MVEHPSEQLDSLTRIESGGIPLSAERRLSELRESGASFTSELSVNGFALCDQLGLRVLSQVMGSSIYQTGYQSRTPLEFGGQGLVELDLLSEALNEVRERALGRMAQEASHVGADTVVGVSTRAGTSELQGGSLMLEHGVVGTAVSGGRKRSERPVLTELSVADYAKLLSAGFEPVGIVAWTSVFFGGYTYAGMLGLPQGGAVGPRQNYELREFTQAVYGARETVMQRISSQAEALGAAGVVGVRIGHTVQSRSLGGGMLGRETGGMMVTFEAIGTAIREHGQATALLPKPIIDLNG